MAGLRLALTSAAIGECGVTEAGMLWTLVLAAAVAGGDFLTNGNSTHNASEGWMAHLRSQLMQDNYDYEPSSDEPGLLPGLLDEEPEAAEPPPPQALRGGAPEPADDEPREDAAWLDQNNEIEDQPTTVDNLYVPTFRNYPDNVEERGSEMKENDAKNFDAVYYTFMYKLKSHNFTLDEFYDLDVNAESIILVVDNTGRRLSRLSALANVSRGTRRRGVSQQDLLYYVDDAWLHRDDDDNDDRRADRDNNELSSGDSDLSDGRRAFDSAPTTKTYKLLKLPGSARRDGQGPRFVEERSAQGVALLSLDGAPFPSFRLPHERRQYQEMELD